MCGEHVLVLDSQGPNGLALCRSLGKKGLGVTAGGSARFLPGMLSKYTVDSYVHPDPLSSPDAFLDDLESHLRMESYEAVFALTDATTTLLSRHRERLATTGTEIGVEEWETFLDANDKGRLFEIAVDLDVPAPRTWTPESMADVAEIDEQRTGTVVVKPRRTTIYDGSSVQQKRIDGDNYVEADADLVDHYRTLLTRNPSLRDQYPLVQAFVDGTGTMATVGLADDGEFCSVFQHEKFRVYPPSGGIGAVRKGVDEPLMRRYAERVVDALGWTGPCHVEFMRTPDGDFHLLEVNGRYWGSLALTINSGVDVPWHHYQLLTGDLDSAVGPPTYATDIRQRKLFYQDIRWLRDQLERGNLGALVPFVTSFFNTRDEFLCPEDLTPLLGLLVRTAMIVSRRQSEWG